MGSRRWVIAGALVATVALAACGGGGDGGGAEDGGTPSAGQTLSVTASEFKFEPSELAASPATR